MHRLGSWLRNSSRRPPRELTATASRNGNVATELRRDTSDVGVVQRMLGHEDTHMTEAYYGRYDLSDLEAAFEAFAR